MGLFDRFYGSTIERRVSTSHGALRVAPNGVPRFSAGQRVAISFVLDIWATLGRDAVGRPYGPGNGLDDDVLRLRAVAPMHGGVEEIASILSTTVGVFIREGVYTRTDLLEVMGLRPDGLLVRPRAAHPHRALEPFCRYVVELMNQAIGLGGAGGDAVDQYAELWLRQQQVAAWMAQAHARFDLRGTTKLPDRSVLTRP